ncbi:MAG: tryptophan-rich sensory protein [Opitutae bacterium]|nr:tryptophan-rich sensory protein [Opitutae bacterium]
MWGAAEHRTLVQTSCANLLRPNCRNDASCHSPHRLSKRFIRAVFRGASAIRCTPGSYGAKARSAGVEITCSAAAGSRPPPPPARKGVTVTPPIAFVARGSCRVRVQESARDRSPAPRGSVLATIRACWRVDRPAGFLLPPYAAWVAFASVLNGTIWWMN